MGERNSSGAGGRVGGAKPMEKERTSPLIFQFCSEQAKLRGIKLPTGTSYL